MHLSKDVKKFPSFNVGAQASHFPPLLQHYQLLFNHSSFGALGCKYNESVFQKPFYISDTKLNFKHPQAAYTRAVTAQSV
jgi:hypothetical protein